LTEEEKRQEEAEISLETRRWQSRRRCAAAAFLGLFLVLLLLIILPEKRIEVIQAPLMALIYTFGGIIAAYMGLATWAQFKK
jgi:hypothetical protein